VSSTAGLGPVDDNAAQTPQPPVCRSTTTMGQATLTSAYQWTGSTAAMSACQR